MRLLKLSVILFSAILLQGCIAAAVVGLAGGVSVATDNRTVGNQFDDQKIELKAHSALANDSAVNDNAHLQVVSINGSVLIIGQAPNTYIRDLALKAVKEVEGVVQIFDQIRIGTNTSMTTRTNDLWITSKVKAALLSTENLDAINVKVVTENGEVFLLGYIDKAQADKAVDVARNVTGVSRVFKMFEYQE